MGEHIIILRYLNSTEPESVQTTLRVCRQLQILSRQELHCLWLFLIPVLFGWIRKSGSSWSTPVLMVSGYRIIKQYGFSNYCFTDNNNTVYSGGIRFEWLSISARFTLTVNSLPIVNLGNFSDICINGNAFTLSGGTPAGRNIQRPGCKRRNF